MMYDEQGLKCLARCLRSPDAEPCLLSTCKPDPSRFVTLKKIVR